MPLSKQPRIAYSQPDAFCRTLVFRWAGFLLGGSTTETAIIGSLVTAQDRGTVAYDQVRSDHRAGTKTKAYAGKGGFSDVTTTTSHGRAVNYMGFVIVKEKELSREILHQGTGEASRFADVDDRSGAIRESLVKAIQDNPDPRQLAFAISLHYAYPKVNQTSGHTVGVFLSRGGSGARRPGARFLDPNIGSWQFADLDGLLQFFSDDWLPNFVANSMKADPGHGGKGPRQLTYFRLVGILAV